MASILDLLNTQTGDQLVNKASEKTSEDKSKITSVLGMAMPLILGAMKKNAKDPKGAESLDKALQDEKHNGKVLDNLEEKDPEELTNEGSKILSHVLGAKQSGVSKTIAGTLNIDESTVNNILEMAAPVIMGLLGQQKRKDNVSSSDLSGLLGSVMGSGDSHDQSFLETLLDGDGSMIEDVTGMAFGGKKAKKRDSLLGGMLGGK